jgi:beta-galactosidase/beta-glucuronidase
MNAQSANSPAIPRPEYPRPRFVRERWLNLNGEWEFAYDGSRDGLDRKNYEAKELWNRITVPFTYQWPMSGLNNQAIEEVVWYARTFDVPEEWLTEDQELLLHFGAVDYRCQVWINGIEVAFNEGGHVPFSVEIARFVKPGPNRVALRVEDSQDPAQPRGKQASNGKSHGIDYPCTTGIWQTVWLEPVSRVHIEDLILTPKFGATPDEDALSLRAILHGPAVEAEFALRVKDHGQTIAEAVLPVRNAVVDTVIPMPNAKRWSPDTPHLYDVEVELWRSGKLVDSVQSYAGIRSIEIKGAEVLLNGQPIYLKLVLDQGYWPQSGLTGPSDEAIKSDVEYTKAFGYNGARKHQKVEDPRWLYWCDRLGLLVWDEMANARAWSPQAEDRLLLEWQRVVRRDISHPSVMAWVPFNESWGLMEIGSGKPKTVAFAERLVNATRAIDGSRPVVDNDGWEHTDLTDLHTIHDYTKTGAEVRARYADGIPAGTPWSHSLPYTAKGSRYFGQPVIISETGGLLTKPEGVAEDKLDPLYGAYETLDNAEELVTKYRDILLAIAEIPDVKGFCYTQLTDVEQEMNGLLTYDRRPKVAPERIAAIHQEMDQNRKP